MKISREGLLQQFNRAQGGTALTEFVIALPVFLLLFNFIFYMGATGNTLTYEWNDAQRQLWTEVRTNQQMGHEGIQQGATLQHAVHPAAASAHALDHLQKYSSSKHIEQIGNAVDAHERGTYGALASNGHWGESAHRAGAVNTQVPVFIDGNRGIATHPNDVVGGSGFATALVDDTSSAQPIQFDVNNGLPAVVGASVRYGVAHVVREVNYEFPNGRSFPVAVELNVLVPPRPPYNAEYWAVQVARPQLDRYGPYANLPGISSDQPLSKESAPGVPEIWSSPDN